MDTEDLAVASHPIKHKAPRSDQNLRAVPAVLDGVPSFNNLICVGTPNMPVLRNFLVG